MARRSGANGPYLSSCNIAPVVTCKDDEVKLRMRKGEKVCNERPLPKLLQDCANCDVQPLKKR